MPLTRLTIGQGSPQQLLNPQATSLRRILNRLDTELPDAYLILEWEGSRDYLQTLRTPEGYLVECRFFRASTKAGYTHYRAWDCLSNPFSPGEPDPYSGEHGPWTRERDFIPQETTEILFSLLLKEKPTSPPALSGLQWRDVTNEFPTSPD
ncbi:MAG: hypothetical protein ACSHYB_01995 [Roseibacillus sp.]